MEDDGNMEGREEPMRIEEPVRTEEPEAVEEIPDFDIQEEVKKGAEEKEFEGMEEEALREGGENLYLREKVRAIELGWHKEKNKELELKVKEMEEKERAPRAYTRLGQRDSEAMEDKMERMEENMERMVEKEKDLKDKVLELMKELEEARSMEKVKLVEKAKEASLANEAMKKVSLSPVLRSQGIREKQRVPGNEASSSSDSGNGNIASSSWDTGSGRGKVSFGSRAANSSGTGKFGKERKVKSGEGGSWGTHGNKRVKTESEQEVGGFGRTEVRGGVRITAELAAYYHKNWKIWYKESVEVDFKGVGPNRGWKFLADLNKEELKRVSLSIKDNTGMGVRRDMKVELMEKRLQGVETELKKLQFFYMERRRLWLEEGDRKGWKDELAERETVVVVKAPFKPVLKAIQEIKEEWEYWKGTLGNERAARVRAFFGKLTRDHLFWICNPEQCWSRFVWKDERMEGWKMMNGRLVRKFHAG